MAIPKSYEMRILEPLENCINGFCTVHKACLLEGRFQILEYWASTSGGFHYASYNKLFGIQSIFGISELKAIVTELRVLAAKTKLSVPMIIASLAREPMDDAQLDKTRAYYTDYRLAKLVANSCERQLTPTSSILDPSCGTGILLVSIAEMMKTKYPESFSTWIASHIYACDLSKSAIRGARIALSSMIDNAITIKEMCSRWLVQDSLLSPTFTWEQMRPQGFDVIVGNPPWGKARLSRHDYLIHQGYERCYGEDYLPYDELDYSEAKNEALKYIMRIKKRFDLVASQDFDLYLPFIQLSLSLLSKDGVIAMLLPAAIIRAQGSKTIRQYIFDNCSEISFTLMDNKPAFFTIDTRFKFVLLNARFHRDNDVKPDCITLTYGHSSDDSILLDSRTVFPVAELVKISPDFTLPEVKGQAEYDLFVRLCITGENWTLPQSAWYPEIMREVDMTSARARFTEHADSNSLPIIEGRMIQQHRFGAKAYVEGRGRKATWKPIVAGKSRVIPQFWMPTHSISKELYHRGQQYRAGFCDIAGQTNERAMVSALIPPNVLCGNKVPTLLFPNDPSLNRLLLWIGITNSFVFDWMVRRVVSTTLNYFVLFSLPLPKVDIHSSEAQAIVQATLELNHMDNSNYYDWPRMARLRSEIDATVAKLYELTLEDMLLIMQDFPLLDRKQPIIRGEARSTITRDCVLAAISRKLCLNNDTFLERVKEARKYDALPYIPTEMVEISKQKGVQYNVQQEMEVV